MDQVATHFGRFTVPSSESGAAGKGARQEVTMSAAPTVHSHAETAGLIFTGGFTSGTLSREEVLGARGSAIPRRSPRRASEPMPLAKWSAVALSSALIACSSSSDSSSATFPASALTTVTSASGAHTLEVRTSPSQPPSRGTSSVEFIVRDQQGALEDGLTIDVTPWMPAMGHGTSVVPEVSQTAEGTYVARNVALFMPGTWELRSSLHGTVEDSATISLEIP